MKYRTHTKDSLVDRQNENKDQGR